MDDRRPGWKPYHGEIDGVVGYYWLTPSPVDGHPPYVEDMTNEDVAAVFGGCPANTDGMCRPDYQNGVCFDCGLPAGYES